MWRLHPEVYALYPDSSVHIICDIYEASISNVIEVVSPPSKLLRLQLDKNTVTPVDRLVSA